jgi:site-specific recombinase XerC
MKSSSFAELLQAYFTERLVRQRNASPNTIASHRDTFRLLLEFAQQSLNQSPSALQMPDLDAPFIGRFLHHVEKDRGNAPQTRNVRLAAIHSFFKYVVFREPALSGLVQRVLAIPTKRHKTKPVDFLTRIEIDALVAAPDPSTWAGRRDRTLLLVAVPCKQACELQNSSGCAVRTSCWERARTFAAWAKVAGNVAPLCAKTRWRLCVAGWPSVRLNLLRWSFPTPAALR